MNLDDLTGIRRLDADHMLGRIQELPDQCEAAWEQCQDFVLPPDYDSVDRVAIVGMGGSAIGGALLKGVIADQCPVPLTVVRDYALPAFIGGPSSLVVACSYSGNTEETLSCLEQALTRETRVVAVTTGGKLSSVARDAGAPVLEFEYQSQPRAALGYSFVLLLGLAYRLGLIRDYGADIAESVQVMRDWQEDLGLEVPQAQNEAKQMATDLEGTLPVVYGAGFLSAVANRWKTQLNENAKQWGFFETLPEVNHNGVVGLGIPPAIRDLAAVLMLRSRLDPDRIQARWRVTRELLAREGVATYQMQGRGEGHLAQMLSLIHFGDYVSFYLAVRNDVDPTPVENIAFLKERLGEMGSAVD